MLLSILHACVRGVRNINNIINRSTRFRFLFAWLPLLVGLLSLLWFLIRVVPKPSRAMYPCQRAAFPLASAFVIWLTGTVTSWLIFQKARRLFHTARPILACCTVVAALAIAAVAFYNTPLDKSQAAIYPDELATSPQMSPNSPIGVPDGVNPGRVVWVHDPDATDWNGTGDWRDDSTTDQNVTDQMLADAIKWLAGELTEEEAWNTMFHHFNLTRGKGDVGYQSTEKINVKINLVTCIAYAGRVDSGGNQLLYLNDVSVSRELVLSLLKQLVNKAGVPQANIYIGDTTAVLPNYYYNYWSDQFPNVVYISSPEYSLPGRTTTRYPDTGQGEDEHFVYWSKPGVMTDPSLNPDIMPVSYSESDYFINFPVMKTHQPGYTLCGKNLFGSFIRFPSDWAGHYDYFDWHNDNGRMGTEPGVNDVAHYRPQVDMLGHIDIDGKNILNVIDALWTGYNWGDCSPPLPWRSTPFNNDYMSSILVSQDVVAIDSVAQDFWWAEDATSSSYFPFVDGCGGGAQAHQPRQRGADDYLIDAAIHENADPMRPEYYRYDDDGQIEPIPSLGVHERWNNATNKQYSRNLGADDGIELVTHEYFNIYYTSTPPNVTDGGAIDTVWDSVRPRYCSHEVNPGTTAAPRDDFSGFFKALWDEDYLYVYVEVTDERPLHDSPTSTYWLNDNVELFLDASYDSYDRTTYDGVDDFEYGFCWNDPVVYVGNNSVNDTTGVVFQTITTASGWRLEAAVPWLTTLGYSPSRADFVGFDMHISDDDTDNPPDERDNKLAWYSINDNSWINPSLFVKTMLDGPPPVIPTGEDPPAAPSSLVAAFITTTQADLDWVDNASDEDGFIIERKTGSGSYSPIADLPENTIAYSDTTVSTGSTYTYRIYAYNTYGNSDYSNEAVLSVQPPAAPTGLAATPDDAHVELMWSCNTEPNVLYYIVYKSTTSPTSGFAPAAVAFQACHIADSNVYNGTTYYYRVLAVDTLGLQSSYSSTISTIPNPPPPAAPTNLASVAGDGVVDLTWSPNTEPDLSHYNVYRSLSQTAGYSLRAEVYSAEYYNDTSVSNGTTYYYRITAVNTVPLESDYSNTISATPQSQQAPDAPSILIASAISTTQIDLDWQDNASDETGFKIERKTGAGSFSQIDTVSANTTSYNDTGLDPGTLYTYRVRAYNTYGDSAYSNEASATTTIMPSDATIEFSATTPVIDGTVDAVWSGLTTYDIDNEVFTPVNVCSGQWRALWTATGLYMLVEVTDDTLQNDSSGSWWDDDTIEIYIDADNSKLTSYDGINDFQYGLRYNDSTVRIGNNSVNDATGVTFELVSTASGYRLEITMPWSTLLGSTPGANDLIGIEVHINDDDDGGSRDSKIAWYGTSDNCWQDPSTFATAILTN